MKYCLPWRETVGGRFVIIWGDITARNHTSFIIADRNISAEHCRDEATTSVMELFSARRMCLWGLSRRESNDVLNASTNSHFTNEFESWFLSATVLTKNDLL